MTGEERQHLGTLIAVLMREMGADHVIILPSDIRELPPNTQVDIQERDDGLHISLLYPS